MDRTGTVAGVLGPPGEGCTMIFQSLNAPHCARARPLHDQGGMAPIMRTLRPGARRVTSVLILLGIGTVWARAADDVKKDKPGNGDKPGAKADKPGEKKFKFQAIGEPWPKFFEWFAKETG